MAYIYKITNNINNKVYIGKTQYENPIKRFNEHQKESQKKRAENRPLYKAMSKYGIENFSFEVLEETDNPNEREKYYIQYFNSYGNTGYNATIGGDGKSYIEHQPIIDCYNQGKSMREVAKELNICQDTVSAVLKIHNIPLRDVTEPFKKKVIQLDKDSGEIIAEYESILAAAKAMGGRGYLANISRCCHGKRKTTLGYKWAFKTS